MINKVILFTFSLLVAVHASADNYWGNRSYEVTVTNITKGQSFTPILSATHRSSIGFFELGGVASPELADLAESGNTAPLQGVLSGLDEVSGIEGTAGLLNPGNSITFEISGGRFDRFSLAAMLIPTNDTFVALDTVRLPRHGARTYFARAYDAGSEMNDELCANIPGPVCGGEGASEADGEGFVHISAGISGEADLAASAYDWRDAVAKVTIRRVR